MPSILSFACSLAVPMYGCDTAKIPKFCRMQRKSGKDFTILPFLSPLKADATGCFLFPAEYHLDGS